MEGSLTQGMNAITIRAATDSDAEAVARLLTDLGYPTSATDVPGRRARLTAGGRGAILLAVGDGTIGLATVHVLSVLNRPRDVAWLTALVVDERARGQGVGRALVGAVESYARAAGCERLSVTTHEASAGARAFYPRVGLAPTGRRFGKQLS